MEIDNRTYKAYDSGRVIQVEAKNSYQAQLRDAETFGARKVHQVSVVLADVPVDLASIG